MSMQSLRRALLGAALYALAAALPAAAQSAFPAKPVTLIVPFLPAAPPTATCASWRRTHPSTWASPSSWKTGRAPAARWGRPTWPRPLPDGYTISLYTLAMLRMPYMHKTHWDPINDFTFLIGLSGYTFGFTVRADSPYRTFNDYIEAARKAPAASTTARPARARRRTC